jgi:hypothetical protein
MRMQKMTIAKEVLVAVEVDSTPYLFQNHMQLEDNLAEMQWFASENGYPREIIHSI